MMNTIPRNNAVDYVQKQFSQKVDEIDNDLSKINKKKLFRLCLAYSLKAMAIFGSIAITAGVDRPVSNGIGVAITVAVGLDFLLYNSRSLLVFAQAVEAYKALRKRVVRKHQTELIPIITLAENGDDSASAELVDLNTKLIEMSNVELEKIEKAIADRNVDALKVLEVDNNRTGN